MDKSLIERIKNGEEGAIRELYRMYWEEFKNMSSQKYPSCPPEDKEEIYQDMIMAFIRVIMSGKLEEEDHAKTYLMRIGLNKLSDWHKKQVKERQLKSDIKEQPVRAYTNDSFINDERIMLVKNLMNELDETCQKVLRLCVWGKMTGEEVAGKLGMKDRKVVAVKKRKCIKKLIDMLQDKGALQ